MRFPDQYHNIKSLKETSLGRDLAAASNQFCSVLSFVILNFKGHNISLSRRAPLLSFSYNVIQFKYLLGIGGINKMKMK